VVLFVVVWGSCSRGVGGGFFLPVVFCGGGGGVEL